MASSSIESELIPKVACVCADAPERPVELDIASYTADNLLKAGYRDRVEIDWIPRILCLSNPPLRFLDLNVSLSAMSCCQRCLGMQQARCFFYRHQLSLLVLRAHRRLKNLRASAKLLSGS